MLPSTARANSNAAQNEARSTPQRGSIADSVSPECRLENRVVKFEIWDTAGQERFHSLAPMYYRNAAAAVVVYDITKAASLEKAKAWVKELQRQANPNIVIALVGNKLDLVEGADGEEASTPTEAPEAADEDAPADEDEDGTPPPPAAAPASEGPRQVSHAEAKAYADECGLLFFEASAKAGTNVQDVFTEIGECRLSSFLLCIRARRADTLQPRPSLSTPSPPSPLPAVPRTAARQPTLLRATPAPSTSATVPRPRRVAAAKPAKATRFYPKLPTSSLSYPSARPPVRQSPPARCAPPP